MTQRYSRLSEYKMEKPEDIQALYEAMKDLKAKSRTESRSSARQCRRTVDWELHDRKFHKIVAKLWTKRIGAFR